ncbi:MAG: hypothetical protein U5K71_16525 [Gracilimonas sp.]|nr:hypothetical protein [Gracilimonas sp.]
MLILYIGADSAMAQYNIQHQPPVAIERNSITQLQFSVPGLLESDIQQARLFYRYDGDFSYSQMEVYFRENDLVADFSVDNPNASVVEYYLEVELISGDAIYFPAILPSENPVRVEIVEGLQSDSDKPKIDGIDYTILSPQPGNGLTKDDVLIAIALFYNINVIEPGEFKLYLNGIDMSEEADASDYYVSYKPKGLRSGFYTVELAYETSTEEYSVVQWQFSVVEPGAASFSGFGENNIPQISAELTARNQVISDDVNNAYTGRTRVSGKYGLWKYSLNGYLTSQGSDRLQSQNRYGIDLMYSDWFMFEAGHVYPTMSDFTITGRRIQGLNTNINALDEKLQFQFMYGKLDRSITNLYDSLVVRDVLNSTGDVVSKNYLLTYQDQGRGTFNQKLIGGRVSVGDERKWQIGLHAMKIHDDTTSILNARNYLDIVNSGLDLNSDLTQQDRDNLLSDPSRLAVDGGNIKPKENVVLGTDLKMGFMGNTLRLESDAAISALNNNVYGGPLTTERADELGFDITNDAADFLDRLSWLIIVNENMSALPFKFDENENGDLVGDLFLPSSVFATNHELLYRDQNNNARLQYRWIGPNFFSLANSTIRRDLAGFTASDRLNLLSNQLYLTVGFEHLKDNVANTRDATTKTITYRTNASWYPVDRSLPRINVGLRYRTRDNGVDRQNYLVSSNLLNSAVLNIRQEIRTINGQDTLVTTITPSPRQNRTVNFTSGVTQQFEFMDARNDASLNFNTLSTTDDVFAFGDVTSSSLSLNLNSRFYELPLESRLGLTYNYTTSGSGQNEIRITGLYAGGNYRILEEKFSLNGRLAFTNNKVNSKTLEINENGTSEDPKDDYYEFGSFTDSDNFQTYVLQLGARYDFDQFHALLFDANLTNVSGGDRANDRIIQLRYLFRF